MVLIIAGLSSLCDKTSLRNGKEFCAKVIEKILFLGISRPTIGPASLSTFLYWVRKFAYLRWVFYHWKRTKNLKVKNLHQGNWKGSCACFSWAIQNHSENLGIVPNPYFSVVTIDKRSKQYIKIIRITRPFSLLKFYPALLAILDVFSYRFSIQKGLSPSVMVERRQH